MEPNLNEETSRDEIFLQPLTYISQIQCRQIDSKLSEAFNVWLKIPDDKFQAIEKIIELFYNAYLLIDDIQDDAILRHQIPVAHSIYGIASTIIANKIASYSLYEKVLNLNHPDAVKVYTEILLELGRGQGMDIYWRNNFICPSEEEYKQMATRKCGVYTLTTTLMQLFSDRMLQISKLAGILGLYMQILNDYENLRTQQYLDMDNYCDDLTEGKFSFPIIHAIHTQPNDGRLKNILRQRTKNYEVKKFYVSLLKKYGSLKYTWDTITDLDKQIREEIQILGGNPYMEKILDDILMKSSHYEF